MGKPMVENKNFTFRISVSKDFYKTKDEARACLFFKGAKKLGREKMAFREMQVTTSEFLEYAISGYAFCGLFQVDANKKYPLPYKNFVHWTYPVYRRGKNKGCFKLQFKTDNNFIGSQCVFVDVDYTRFESIDEYLACLTFLPSAVYMSYSDKSEKHGIVSRRFRMVYVFDSVLGKDDFKNVAKAIHRQIEKDTHEIMYDNCGTLFSQYMNGCFGNTEHYNTNLIYSIGDFILTTATDSINEKKTVEEKTVEETSCTKAKKTVVQIDKHFLADLHDMSYKSFVRKYSKIYKYFTHTVYEDFINGVYKFTDENFVALFWNDEKVQDGNKRRKKLYDRAALRRIMKPNVSVEELIYNLYIDVYRFFDNSDDVLNADLIIAKAKRAFLIPIEDLKDKYSNVLDYYKNNKPEFVINQTIIDKKKAVGEVRKQLKDEKIGELYDLDKSVEENIVFLNANGIKVAKSRIYQFLKENGLKQEKKVIAYNPELSVRENMKRNNCTKYQVEKAKKEYELQHQQQVDYTALDRYFADIDGESAAAFFRFYGDFESLYDGLTESVTSKFGITTEEFRQYYSQYQPWVGVHSYYR